MSKLFGVPGEVVDAVWPEVEHLVTRCLNKVGEYRWDAEDIRNMLRANDAQLWLCLDNNKMYGVVVTELLRFPKAFECNLFMMAGKMPDDWRDCLAQVENWARDMGCTHMSSLSRPGSAKLLGYSKGLICTHRGL